MRQMLKLNPIVGTKDQFPVAVGVVSISEGEKYTVAPSF